MLPTERRRRLRLHLAGDACARPASVFDPLSSRLAYGMGFEIGMLGGSIASAAVLGAPDVAVITLTELADQVRRITRASDISQIVDADNGYGNALNAMRTVRELEDAGASGMTLEDTDLPSRYGSGGKEALIPLDEMTDKLRAAVEARQDPETVLIGRCHAINATSLDDALVRVAAYAETGVDAIFLMGIREPAQLEAVRGVTSLPFVLGNTSWSLTDAMLAPYGVKLALRGHGAFTQTVRAMADAYERQLRGEPDDPDREPAPETMASATAAAAHRAARERFAGG